MTERGYEGFTYSYSKDPFLDGSKPLTLLNHVGGNPLFAAVGRSKVTGDYYKLFSKWVKVAYGHADEILKAHLTGDEKDEYLKFMAQFVPLAKRFDENTITNLIPSLADGQHGFVVDAKWESKQWIKHLPATPKAMPMLEFGVVLGVSDPDKLRKAMGEYLTLVDDLLGAVRAIQGAAGAIGDFRMSKPGSAKRPAGTLYFYTLPDILGLDRRVVPTAGLSDKVAVLTLSHAHAERLLASKPLKVDGGPLADLKKPLAGAFYCDWPAFIDAITPWVEFGANAILDQQFIADGPDKKREAILAQVRTVLEVLKVYRGTTSATYLEDGVIVTHSESVFKDLAK